MAGSIKPVQRKVCRIPTIRRLVSRCTKWDEWSHRNMGVEWEIKDWIRFSGWNLAECSWEPWGKKVDFEKKPTEWRLCPFGGSVSQTWVGFWSGWGEAEVFWWWQLRELGIAARKHKWVVNCVTYGEHCKTLMGIKRPYFHKWPLVFCKCSLKCKGMIFSLQLIILEILLRVILKTLERT